MFLKFRLNVSSVHELEIFPRFPFSSPSSNLNISEYLNRLQRFINFSFLREGKRSALYLYQKFLSNFHFSRRSWKGIARKGKLRSTKPKELEGTVLIVFSKQQLSWIEIELIWNLKRISKTENCQENCQGNWWTKNLV